jgi:hypothetical protein
MNIPGNYSGIAPGDQRQEVTSVSVYMRQNPILSDTLIMRCLVTGVASFVGSHLVERLLADGQEAAGIDAFIYCYDR